MRRSPVGATVVVAAVLLAGCGGGGPSRADVVSPIVTDAVPARFDAYATRTDELQAAVDAWCEQGGTAPISDVAETRSAWYALKPFWAGPVMERRSQYLMNFRVDTEGIEQLLASDDPVDPDSLRQTVGADQRGLGALAVLLGGEPDPRRCAYALGIADMVAQEAHALAEEWHGYGASLVSDESTANDAIRDIVSNATFAFREVEMDPEPDIERGLIDGARWAMLGDAEPGGADDEGRAGMAPLLDHQTVSSLTDEFARDDAAAAALTIAVDAVSQLGITLNFSDADGDG